MGFGEGVLGWTFEGLGEGGLHLKDGEAGVMVVHSSAILGRNSSPRGTGMGM